MPFAPGFVSFLNRFGFGHVFALFGGPVETRAFFVINMRFGVNPNKAMASARRRRFCRCLSACGERRPTLYTLLGRLSSTLERGACLRYHLPGCST
jgi:hypothetical protein